MKVFAVLAHMDDEVLMCGGTLAKHAAAGDDVFVLTIADGVSSRDEVPADAFYKRLEMANKASDILGIDGDCIALPDNKLDTVPRLTIIKHIEKVIKKIQPEIVYTHWHGDMNIDHRVVSDACKVACRPQPGSTVKTLLMGEVQSSTEWAGGFNPNWFVSLSRADMDKKCAALDAYGEEMRGKNHPRSVETVVALNGLRGTQVGVDWAEAFEVARNIT